MNKLKATVTKIETLSPLNIVSFDAVGQTVSMMSLDLDETITVGCTVELTVKPSHITIAKSFTGVISCANQLKAKVKSIDKGQLLSGLGLEMADCVVEAMITAQLSEAMALKVGDEVMALINASEISIVRVL